MKNIVVLIALLFLFSNCDKANSEKQCEIDATATGPAWMTALKSKVDASCGDCFISIFKATYRGDTVYFTLMNAPACDGFFKAELLNCDGQIIKKFGSNDYEEFQKQVLDKKIFYHCPGQVY